MKITNSRKRSRTAIVMMLVMLISVLLSAGQVIAQDEAPPGEPESLVVKAAIPLVPKTLSPRTNNVAYTNPTFKWYPSAGANAYVLRIYSYNTKTFIKTKLVYSSACGTKCVFTFHPSLKLGYGVYYFQVAAKNSAGTSAFSKKRVFSRCGTGGFNSQFNGDAVCWQPNYGRKWGWNTATYFSKGIPNKSTNTSYPVNFTNFEYEVKIKRVDAIDQPNTGLLVRGDAKKCAGNGWRNTYDFGVGNDGKYNVAKVINCSFYFIQPQTFTAAINQGGWNVLKVKAVGNKFYFYINGTLVWKGYDSFRSVGKAGVNMWKGGVTERVNMDYATLTVLPTAEIQEEEVNPEQQVLNEASLKEAGME